MIGVEPWIDLIAAAFAGPRMAGPAVVLHEAQRQLPLLESRVPVVWIHPQALATQDFLSLPRCRPLFRERLDATRDRDSQLDVMRRAGLRVLCVPENPRHVDILMAATAEASPAQAWLVYGEESAAGWAAVAPLLQQAGLAPVPGAPVRMLASVSVLDLLQHHGLGTTGLSPRLAQELRRHLPGSLDLNLDLATQSGRPRLRLRADPVHFIAATSDSLAHHVVMEGRALFNQRGLASLLLPWDGCVQVRLLLRNVRARVDDSQIALGTDILQPSFLDYTERGAILSLRLPSIAPGRDALLHLSLPREAVPGDGFCDIGAAEFTADMA